MNKGRRIAIADIHGMAFELLELLNKLNVTPEDEIYFLGDYFDRGPDPINVIDIIIELSTKCKVHMLQGNHDMWMINWFKGGLDMGRDSYEIFMMNGGRITITNYDQLKERNPAKYDRHKKFYLDHVENSLEIELDSDNGKILLCHSGCNHSQQSILWERDHIRQFVEYDKRYPVELAKKKIDNTPLTKGLLEYFKIFCGHTPTPNVNDNVAEPIKLLDDWFIMLDTGSFFTGVISAMDIDTLECWRSTANEEFS